MAAFEELAAWAGEAAGSCLVGVEKAVRRRVATDMLVGCSHLGQRFACFGCFADVELPHAAFAWAAPGGVPGGGRAQPCRVASWDDIVDGHPGVVLCGGLGFWGEAAGWAVGGKGVLRGGEEGEERGARGGGRPQDGLS